MATLVKFFVYEAESGDKSDPTQSDLANAKEYPYVPGDWDFPTVAAELDTADQIDLSSGWLRNVFSFDGIRVHAVYEGGHTLNCWLDEVEGEVRWCTESFSDWTALSELLYEYSGNI